MAISENILLKKMRGRVGKQFVLKQYGEKTVVCKYPDLSQRVLSQKQLRVNEIMEEANYAAKAILADKVLSAEAQVRLNVTRNRLYPALVREYFKVTWEAEKEIAPKTAPTTKKQLQSSRLKKVQAIAGKSKRRK